MQAFVTRAVLAAVVFSLAGVVHAWNETGGEQEAALGLTPNLENGMDIYEVRSACHLPEGWGLPDGTFPQLAGQHRGVLIKQLSDIRSHNRDNPTMYPFALSEAIGDAQALADVVAYIEKLPMDPEWGKGPSGPGTPEYAHGEKLYKENCVMCHGETGLGDAERFYPRINGQHYGYMLRQFEWIRDGKRRNANPEMVEQIKRFGDEDMHAVISYVSWQPVPPEQLAATADWRNPDYE